MWYVVSHAHLAQVHILHELRITIFQKYVVRNTFLKYVAPKILVSRNPATSTISAAVVQYLYLPVYYFIIVTDESVNSVSNNAGSRFLATVATELFFH